MNPEVQQNLIVIVAFLVLGLIIWSVLKSIIKAGVIILVGYVLFQVFFGVTGLSPQDIFNKENVGMVQNMAQDAVKESNKILENLSKE